MISLAFTNTNKFSCYTSQDRIDITNIRITHQKTRTSKSYWFKATKDLLISQGPRLMGSLPIYDATSYLKASIFIIEMRFRAGKLSTNS